MARRVFERHQPDVCLPCWLKAGVGAFAAFGIALALGDITGASVIVAPMAASAALIYGVPESPLSQPAHVVGGHGAAAAVVIHRLPPCVAYPLPAPAAARRAPAG